MVGVAPAHSWKSISSKKIRSSIRSNIFHTLSCHSGFRSLVRPRNLILEPGKPFRIICWARNMATAVSGNAQRGIDIASLPRTSLTFQLPVSPLVQKTTILEVLPYRKLSESDQFLFKPGNDDTLVVISKSTIFHPQGGGQPSDEGTLNSLDSEEEIFRVRHVRHSSHASHVVLHFGSATSKQPRPGDQVGQRIDKEKRLLYSRLHTAGHTLGAATRNLLEEKIVDFDELKASHFPDSASCEFKGSIGGEWKQPIQDAVDDLVKKDMVIKIEWWTKQDFISKSLERLIPPQAVWKELAVSVTPEGQDIEDDASEDSRRVRVVNIVGAEIYPCGGTHVSTTADCGKIVVKKISRQKGTSRISYNVD